MIITAKTQKEAKLLGQKYYIPTSPCKRGEVYLRKASDRHCVCEKCRAFKSKRDKEYVSKNKAKKANRDRDYHARHKKKRNEYARKWRIENRDKCMERDRIRYEQEREALLESEKLRYQANKKAIHERRKAYYKKNPKAKAAMFCYRCIHRVIDKKTESHDRILGYSYSELAKDIEKKFKNGMTWDNYGEWHIDHIKPIKAFIDDGITDPAIINALDNLQPLWASENLSKGAKYDEN